MKYKHHLFCVASALLLFSITGCHSDSHNDTTGNPVAPGATSDTFITAVLAFIATSPEDADTASTDSFTATAPETTEPVVI